MMNAPRVMIVEDDEDDFILARDLLQEVYGADIEVDWAPAWKDGLDALVAAKHDVFLVDYRLGARDGLDLVQEANAQGCMAPIILLSGQDSPEIDLRAMSVGAQDYLVKDSITADQLARAIRYGINQKRVEKRLIDLAQYDSLTGLANRSLFHDRLDAAIAQARRDDRNVAVLLLDLDRFKDINDTFGHPAGDALLKSVAARLKSCMRETDIVARISGDEFAIIATNLERKNAASRVADKICASFKDPFQLNGRDVYISVSIGISILDQGMSDSEPLLKNADVAMYQAKLENGAAFRYFDEAMNEREQAFKLMEHEIRVALQRQDFILHYQPKLNLETGEVVGVEALLRWPHRDRGMVPPSDIIPIAEATGLIQPIGAWVLRQSCAQIKKWRALGLPPIPIAANTSALQFKRAGLVDVVSEALADADISPDLLELEITESVAMDRSGVAAGVINQLCDLGVRVTIDDFGTDFATFRLLTDVPVNGIKVDRSFVNMMTRDPKNAAIVKAIILMGRDLGLSVVAEGVETEAEYQFLRGHGCEQVQGWYFSPALPPDQFADWYRTRQRPKLSTIALD
ncbi:MAG: EAL domain-containing protein [Alphaproteobacteria bacterium]|nr:EAL domain-containing protein [Alphaproteobacteria bacterium]